VSTSFLRGEVLEWKNKFGWIKPSKPIDHPLAEKHRGKIYINVIDLLNTSSLSPGVTCEFQLFSDVSGLGAELCWVVQDGDEDWSQWKDEGWEDWESGDDEEDEDMPESNGPGDRGGRSSDWIDYDGDGKQWNVWKAPDAKASK
ncbi:unnamed protein product, partial [Polarella glacialis]